MRYLITLVLIVAIVSVMTSCSGRVDSDPGDYMNPTTMLWDAPMTNTDGTPITDGAGYRLYCGSSSRNYTMIFDVFGWAITSQAVSQLSLPDGAYYCAVTAYDVAGNESAYSSEVEFTIDRRAPVSPSNLRLQ